MVCDDAFTQPFSFRKYQLYALQWRRESELQVTERDCKKLVMEQTIRTTV